jgi:hypothetical protein
MAGPAPAIHVFLVSRQGRACPGQAGDCAINFIPHFAPSYGLLARCKTRYRSLDEPDAVPSTIPPAAVPMPAAGDLLAELGDVEMNENRYYGVRVEGAKYGVGFGSALAMAISYTNNHSILWAIIHGILGWLYVIYVALFD